MRHRSIEYLTDRRFTPTTWENPTSDTNMESIISNLQHKLTGLESKYNQFVGQCAKIFKDNQLRSLNDSISEDPSTFQLMQELSSDRNKFDKELNSMMNFQSSRTETDLQELFKKITIKLSEAKDRAIHVLPQRGDYREKVNEVFIDLLENLYMTVFNKDKQKETNS